MTISLFEKVLILGFAGVFFVGDTHVWAALDINAEVTVAQDSVWRPVRVAGVSPSMSEVLRDVRNSNPSGSVIVSSRAALALAFETAVAGKTGPILVVSDGNKLRVMELKKKEVFIDKADSFTETGAGTKP